MARIAFFLPDFRGGGAERVALTLIEGLRRRGHQVDLVLCRAEGVLLRELDDEVLVVDLRAKRMRHALAPLVRYLRQRHPDGLQASMWPMTSLAVAASWLARVGTRVVISDHTASPATDAGTRGLLRMAANLSIRLLYPFAAARVAVSRGVRRDLAACGVPEESIEVINNPVRPFAVRSGAALPWPAGGPRILSVGNLVPAKNQLLLLDAFAMVAEPSGGQLMICGEGEMRPALERRAEELGIADRVTLPGFVDDIGAAYGSADLYVMSSDREGYSLALVEALQAGLPIVSTDCEHGPHEILAGGEFGTLVPVDDKDALAEAILEGLRSPGDRAPRKARAEQLGGDQLIGRYEALLLGRNAT